MTSKRLVRAVEGEFERITLEEMRAAVKARDLNFGIDAAKETAANKVRKRVDRIINDLLVAPPGKPVTPSDDDENELG